jgi:hypothetical protein
LLNPYRRKVERKYGSSKSRFSGENNYAAKVSNFWAMVLPNLLAYFYLGRSSQQYLSSLAANLLVNSLAILRQ